MIFKIRFVPVDNGCVWKVSEQIKGLKGLQKIRDLFPGEYVPLSSINDERMSEEHVFYDISINTELAEKSGYFENDNYKKIYIPLYGLNQYTQITVYAEKNGIGHIETVTPVIEINKDELLNDWKNAGFPLVWDYAVDKKHKIPYVKGGVV